MCQAFRSVETREKAGKQQKTAGKMALVSPAATPFLRQLVFSISDYLGAWNKLIPLAREVRDSGS